MPTKDFYFTSKGLKELKVELKKLEEDKRPKIIDRVKVARDQGDLSENSEYTAAREELVFIDKRIADLEELIKGSKLINNHSGKNEVRLGSQVTVKINGNEKTYEIVGEMEANPMKDKISDSSPIGKALMSKRKNDSVKIETPAGLVTYQIKNIQ